MLIKPLAIFTAAGLVLHIVACAENPAEEHTLRDHHMEDMDHVAMSGADHSQHMAVLKQAYERKYSINQAEYTLPQLVLLRMDDVEVDLNSELNSDKPVILDFIFTTCTTICPVLSATMAKFQDELGEKRNSVKMISISIDPENDSTSTLRSYAENFNAGSQWQFYTGTLAQTQNAQKAFDAYRGGKMNHIPLFFIKVPNKGNWLRIEGFTSAADLMRELMNSLGS